MFYYTYVLQSEFDRDFYVGVTENLENRLKDHRCGRVESTKNRRPLKLVYFEGCISKKDATKRELYLKTAWGKRYIKGRVREFLKIYGTKTLRVSPVR